MTNHHHAHVYRTLECWLDAHIDTPKARRYAQKVWKLHVEKHGNVPIIRKCTICSGKEQKLDIKHGCWNPARPPRTVRDEDAL